MFTTTQAMNVIRPVIADQMQQFPVFMQISIAKFMKDQGATGGATSAAPVFNTGNVLYKSSGNLFQSFIKNNPNNIYRAKQSGNKFELEYGSKVVYAAIHEFGGFIKGTPLTVIKSKSGRKMKKETTKMAQFFWFKYYKTKAPFFKRIALSVEQKGGVDIKARPYWQNAINDFNSNVKERFTQQMRIAIVQQIQDMQNRTRE